MSVIIFCLSQLELSKQVDLFEASLSKWASFLSKKKKKVYEEADKPGFVSWGSYHGW